MALSEFPRLDFDPFVELRGTQSQMNRLFSGLSTSAAREFPPINVWLGENSVVVTAELPGVTGEDVNLDLQEDVLTLAGRLDIGKPRLDISESGAEAGQVGFLR